MKSVYLAGPITGCSYGECTDWRKYVASRLATDLTPLSPMRGKDYLADDKQIGLSYEGKALSCTRGICTRDRFDCHRADMAILNFAGATKVSIGTCVEIGWLDATRVPFVIVGEPDNVHIVHPMVHGLAGYVVENLDEAISIVNITLSPAMCKAYQ